MLIVERMELVKKVMAVLEEKICIKFEEKKATDSNWVEIERLPGYVFSFCRLFNWDKGEGLGLICSGPKEGLR